MVEVKVRVRIKVRVRVRITVRVIGLRLSNPQIGIQFSNIWPFFTFSSRCPMTALTYTSNDAHPLGNVLKQ
jgi:hypothetical protein